MAGPAEDNIYMQEFMDPKLTTSESLKEEATESTIDELPKPSPRYGHAACKYQGASAHVALVICADKSAIRGFSLRERKFAANITRTC